jgi:osmoprotectant transport system substrate-binding protein
MKRLIICLLLLSLCAHGCARARDAIVIGSKNFTESIILAEIMAQKIESSTGQTVIRKFNLGGTFICHQALLAGQIDIYPEYTGTALTAILKKPPEQDPKAVYQIVKQAYENEFAATATAPFGFNNTFAILVRGEDARQLNLKSISQISQFAPQWRAGFGYEFMERADGFPGFAAAYNLRFKENPKVMDLALTYRALADHQVDLIAGNSTDGLIARLDLFMLNDDKNYFPPYQAVPLARLDTLKRAPAARVALDQLAGKIDEAEMQKLNGLVDVEHRDIAQVVKDFLGEKK